jgi:hypothetical protein
MQYSQLTKNGVSMKRNFLLPLTFSLLTACQEPSKVEVKPLPPRENQNREVVYEGSSGLVKVQIADYENETPTLPSQISVSFEKKGTNREYLIVERLNEAITDLLFSKQLDMLSFGCDDPNQETVLPLKIDAQIVVLCGKIKIPAKGFEMRASLLELRDAELSTISYEKDEFDYSHPNMLTIYTANLVLTGANKLVLEGFTKGRERQRPPALFLNIGKVLGTGNFEIFSRSIIKIANF